MKLVLFTAIGIGGSTLLGTLLGFFFHGLPQRAGRFILAVSTGIMLCAAIVGLLVPAVEMSEPVQLWMIPIGLFAGAWFLRVIQRLQAPLCRALNIACSTSDACTPGGERMISPIMFALAIAMHKLPEGMAAGVGFGGTDILSAMTMAIGIALQNVPEGMVLIPPLLCAGVSRRHTAVIALLTGLINASGVFLGYFAASFSRSVLPFVLAFAGGAMFDVILGEMIPAALSGTDDGGKRMALIGGFALMLLVDCALHFGA